jgi:hypothetical protein
MKIECMDSVMAQAAFHGNVINEIEVIRQLDKQIRQRNKFRDNMCNHYKEEEEEIKKKQSLNIIKSIGNLIEKNGEQMIKIGQIELNSDDLVLIARFLWRTNWQKRNSL